MSEILIYGPIGEDMWEPENSVTAKSIISQLAEIDGDVTVRISSGGGDVYAGIDIMNALRNHPGEVTVIVESLAASAASFVAVGGADKVLVRESSEIMIHKAWTGLMGNSDDVRRTLADLERQDMKLANIYANKAGGTVEQWLEAMSAETWYTAQEAVAAGLADEVIPSKSVAPAVSASLARQRFKFANRAAAPPPPISTPSDGQEGDGMSILNQLAQELGREPEEVQNALSGFFNEAVQINSDIDVTYPEDVKVAPTEKVTVAPLIDGGAGTLPTGVVFEIGTVAEGYTAEVDEQGVVSITAPAGVEPDATADFTVKVNEVEVPLNITVRSLATEEDASGEEAPVETAPAPADAVTLDRETYNDLRAAAQLGWKAMEDEKVAKLDAEVDGWITSGRISASLRDKAIKAIRINAELARDLYGSNPEGTVPRAEVGYGSDPVVDDSNVPSVDDLRALSESRRKSGNK